RGKSMDKTWRYGWPTCMDESIAEYIKRNRREESGFRNRTGGNVRWESRHWRTKSSSTRSERSSTRYGKRIFWATVTDSGPDAVSMMRWMRCGSASCAREWTGSWISTSDLFSTNSSTLGWSSLWNIESEIDGLSA